MDQNRRHKLLSVHRKGKWDAWSWSDLPIIMWALRQRQNLQPGCCKPHVFSLTQNLPGPDLALQTYTGHSLTQKATTSAGHHQPGFGRRSQAGDVWSLSLSSMLASHTFWLGALLVPASAWAFFILKVFFILKWKTKICRFSVLSDFLWFWRPRCLIHTINRLLSYFIYIALFQTRQISYPVHNVSKNNKYQPQCYEMF